MKKIGLKLFEDLSKKATFSKRRRTNFNFHKNYKDKVQRLLNVLKKDTYIRPHLHTQKYRWEVFIILKGKVYVVEYYKNGEVKDCCILDSKGEVKVVELKYNTYHSIIPLKDSVLYELKQGPYIPEKDKIFAPWSPEEEEKEKGLEFNRKVLSKIK